MLVTMVTVFSPLFPKSENNVLRIFFDFSRGVGKHRHHHHQIIISKPVGLSPRSRPALLGCVRQ
jgi:hypothetical protein